MTLDYHRFLFRSGPRLEWSQEEKKVLSALMETLVPVLSKEEEARLLEHDVRDAKAVLGLSQLSGADYRSDLLALVERAFLPEQQDQIKQVLGSLAASGLAQASLETRAALLLSWRTQSKESRALLSLFRSLTMTVVYQNPPEETRQALGLPRLDAACSAPERLPMLDSIEPGTRFDTIVVGSGAGGGKVGLRKGADVLTSLGVVASELAAGGHSVLVIEKGKYFDSSEFSVVESVGYRDLYDYGGMGLTVEGSMGLVTASTFGGGTTINWSASFTPLMEIRQEWAALGLTYFTSSEFSKDIDKVMKRIGASKENVCVNGSGRLMFEGCRKLGLQAEIVRQNSAGKKHACGSCHLGCRAGVKQSTTNSWLQDASRHGAVFLDQTRVERVWVEGGKAVGVECESREGRQFKLRADRVVVSGGTLQSPEILRRSGLKNANLGQHLKLHPATSCLAYFDRETEVNAGEILSVYSNAAYKANEGGCYLESVFLPAWLYAHYFPWEGGLEHKSSMLDIRRAACFAVILRDQDSIGSVNSDEMGNVKISYKMSEKDTEWLLKGVLTSVDILVSAGARKVVTGQFYQAPFEFQADEISSIENPRFIAWKEQVAYRGLCAGDYFCGAAHQMCSNRMGISPEISVVKPTGETWEVKDLYVADASVLPTSAGVNPMVTVEAMGVAIAGFIMKGQ